MNSGFRLELPSQKRYTDGIIKREKRTEHLMDEKDLLIFLTLAETGNLTRTAEKLYLAQPTLSKRLQNMEAELGAQLFLRSKHGVALTPAGEAARETIQKTVDDFEALREHIQQSKGGVGGTLRVEASIDYSNYRLPKILADYTARYPNVNLKVSSDHSRNCVRKLQEGQTYLAIVRGEYDWDEGKILLERESVCLIRSRANADTPAGSDALHRPRRQPRAHEHEGPLADGTQAGTLQHAECGWSVHLRFHGAGGPGLEHRAGNLPLLL